MVDAQYIISLERGERGMMDVILITGGTTGLGLEVVKSFAKRGNNILLCTHHEERAHAVANAISSSFGVKIFTLLADFRESSGPESVYEFCREKKLHVTTLVNSAAMGAYGDFSSSSSADNETALQVNIVGFIDLTYLFLHDMLQAKSGHIINLISTAAFQPGPHMAVYYASQSFLLSFSQGLAAELKGTGVTCTAFVHGPIEGGLVVSGGFENAKIIKKLKLFTAPVVAEKVYELANRGDPLFVMGQQNKVNSFIARILPRRTVIKTMDRLGKVD